MNSSQVLVLATDSASDRSSINMALLLSAILFTCGLIGFLSRRNMIIMFLCTELMFQASALALIAFGKVHHDVSGEVFVIFILTVAAAESAIGLAILVVLFRNRATINVDELDSLKG